MGFGSIVRDNPLQLFMVHGVKRRASAEKPSIPHDPVSLDDIQIIPLTEPLDQGRLQSLLREHHYLGQIKPVGERMLYAAIDPSGRWLAVLVFSAGSKHLKARDQWIGWTQAQRDRRLSLVANNSRFLILPKSHQPNLGSRVLRLTLDRLGSDWQARYGHPVLVIETFVDPEQFQGTDYRSRTESYPPKALATLMLVAMLCDAPRGQKDLAKLARRLAQKQRGALGIRPSPNGSFPAPSQSTFSRFLDQINAKALHERLLQIQAKVRGQTPADELIVVDGKEPRHGPGEAILGAVTVPGQFFLGSG